MKTLSEIWSRAAFNSYEGPNHVQQRTDETRDILTKIYTGHTNAYKALQEKARKNDGLELTSDTAQEIVKLNAGIFSEHVITGFNHVKTKFNMDKKGNPVPVSIQEALADPR